MKKQKLQTITEGATKLRVPLIEKAQTTNPHFEHEVFYNPEMAWNRSISVAVVRAYQEMTRRELRIADPFCAIGARGLRYAKEVPHVALVALNDLDEKALKLARENAKLNKIPSKRLKLSQEDANFFLSARVREKFHVVDLDPFGSPAPFVENASRALVRHNGLLTATYTDLSSLCGRFPERCVQKYGARPLHTSFMKEAGIRIAWASIMREFALENIAITPVLSVSAQHFFKVFGLTSSRPALVKEHLAKVGFVAQCPKCVFFEHREGLLQPLAEKCPKCGSKLIVGGPMFLGELHNEKFLRFAESGEPVFETARKEIGMKPFFFDVESFASSKRLAVPSPKKVVELLQEKGCDACRTQFNVQGVKSTASSGEVEELLLKS